MSRFIFITGGVVSSLGKGIASASLAAILEARGLRVTLVDHDSGHHLLADRAPAPCERSVARCAAGRARRVFPARSNHARPGSRIIAAWGSIEGERVRLALRGADVPARVSRRRSVAHGRVLTGRDRCWRAARQIVRWLGVCALHRCAEGGQRPGCVRLEVVTVGGAVRAGVGRLGARGFELDLLRAVSALCDEAAVSAANDPPARVGVVLEALCDWGAPCLFEADATERRQWMLDRVRARYGARALLWGGCAAIRADRTPERRLPTGVFLTWPGCGGSDSRVPVASGRSAYARSLRPECDPPHAVRAYVEGPAGPST